MKNWKQQKMEHDLLWKEKERECASSFQDRDAVAQYDREITRMRKKLGR